MEYTKGKWIRAGNTIKIHGAGTIAICPSPTEADGVLEFIANALLISSAPDMYAALEVVLGDAHNSSYTSLKRSTRGLIEKSLAKARGEIE